MKVLVVEDEPQLLEIIVSSLDSEDAITEMATDFGSALDKIMSHDYDCIVLDVNLPDNGGIDLLEELKKRGRSEKVLIISSRDSLDERFAGLNTGVNNYLTKPFHIAELIVRVRSIVHRDDPEGKLPIETRRFEEVSEVNFNILCASLIEDLLDVAEHRGVIITVEEDGQLIIPMPSDLAVILLSNLIRNALVYNTKGGTLHIRITESSMTVENTGRQEALDPQKIFNRFYEDPAGRSGLGLGIVRSICESAGIGIRYDYSGKHQFELTAGNNTGS
jgi:DNA-binding response OmpR family regulator